MRRFLPLLLVLFLVRCDDGEDRSCYDDEECGTGEYCDGARPSAGCEGGTPGTCRDLRAEGETCGASWDGGCEPDLICHLAYDPPECRPPSPLGGPCRVDDDCDDDPDHVGSTDDPVCAIADPEAGAPGACAPAGSVASGGPCQSDRACGAPDLCIDRSCRGPGAEGERCAQGGYSPEDRPPCGEGLFCDVSDDVCRRWLAAGEHCWAGDDRCEEGLFCYSQEGVCHVPLAEGSTCIDSDRCAEGLFCSSRAACSAPIPEGEPCWEHDRCAEGLFCYGQEGICHAPLAAGEPCEPYRDVCGAGLACDPEAHLCRAGA